jgi:DNA-binding protein YbaB
MTSFDDIASDLSTLAEQLTSQAAAAQLAIASLPTEPAKAESADGLVTVTATAEPRIQTVEFTPAAFRGTSAETLAASTLEALRAAIETASKVQLAALGDSPLFGELIRSAENNTITLPPDLQAKGAVAVSNLTDTEIVVRDEEDMIEVTILGTGELEQLWLSARAAREAAAEELGDIVKTHTNAAIAKARKARAELTGQDGELIGKLDEITEAFSTRMDGLLERLENVARAYDAGPLSD